MEKEHKEETEKRGSKLVNIVAGAVLGATALLVSGCDYMFSYRTYDHFYPSYYEYRFTEPFGYYHYSYPRYYSYPRHYNPPSHRPSPSHPPIIRPSPPSIRPSPSRPSSPSIRPSQPSRPNSSQRNRR